MARRNAKKDDSFGGMMKYLSLVTQLGLTMTVSVGVCFGIGFYLDHRFSGQGVILLVGVLVGVLCGFVSVYHLLKRMGIFDDTNDNGDIF